MFYYEEARIFSGIANDYVFEALKFVEEIMNRIDVEAAKRRENESKAERGGAA